MWETTKTNMRKKESELGVRYSILLSLPYFNPVCFTVVDIMHNLFLGTGKHMFKTWLELGILNMDDLDLIDKRCRCFEVPSSVGRVPINIASNFGGFKAAQWQTWIIIYSPVVLKKLIPDNHLQCWLLFVRACAILSQRILKLSSINTSDLLLLEFCRKFENLYGPESCTQNLHLHLHLKDCLLDYGPAHSFWCFSFKRYNGLLGSYHTNRKSIEAQIMRKFVHSQQLRSEIALVHPELLSVFPSQQPSGLSTLTDIADDKDETLLLLQYSSSRLTAIASFESCGIVTMLSPTHEHIFEADEVRCLEALYTQLYPQIVLATVSPFYVRSGRVSMCNQVIGSVMNATSAKSSLVVMAYWPSRGNQLSNIDYSRMNVGVVQYFFKHRTKSYISGGQVKESEHIFAYVKWKQSHPHQDWFGISATVCLNMNEAFSMCSFLPVQRICAFCVLDVDINGITENVFVAVPVPIKFSL